MTSSMNLFFFNQIKAQKGWQNLLNYNDKIVSLMNKTIFVGQNFMERLIYETTSLLSVFNKFSNISIALLIISLALTETGIYFFYSAYDRKISFL